MKTTIELAREAGAEFAELPMMDAFVFSVDDKHWNSKELERFVALVRADEREACAKVCESEAEMLKSCAYGANDGRYDWKEDGARDCADAIRNRGNT
jgi:hypothetical protein